LPSPRKFSAGFSAALHGNPLIQLEAFTAFTAGIKDRCAEPPVTVELQQIGRYDHLA
jgi:hypothetical protein